MHDFSQIEEQSEWVEFYGGPADGERFPVFHSDLPPDMPFTTFRADDGNALPKPDIYWYELRQNESGHLKFILTGMQCVGYTKILGLDEHE
jgi:hypothetical protein